MNTTQKVIKYLAIAFAITLIISIFMGIYHTIGAIGGTITHGNSGDGLNINNYPNTSNILSIDIGASQLRIVEGTSLKVETNNKYITSTQDHNKLSVVERSHSIFNKKAKEEVIVYVPKNIIFDKVYISNGAGTIYIENITTQELELELGAGELTIDQITSYNNTDIDGGVGEANLNNAKLHNLDLDMGVGEFTLTGSISGKSEIDAGVGELNINLIDNKDNYRIYTETGIGSIRIDGSPVKDESTYGMGNNKIDIDGGVGSINIRFLAN